MSNELKLEPIHVNQADLLAYQQSPSMSFNLVRLAVRLLPLGKVTAAKILGRRVFHSPRGTASTATGVQLAINRGNIDFFAELAKRHGTWEDHVRKICTKLLASTDGLQVFYDIGANSGYVSLEIANKFREKVSVFAFEPQPDLANNIAVSATLNELPNVAVFQVMLGNDDGESELFLVDDSIHASAVARNESAHSIACTITPLDAMVRDGLPVPNLIKIDVEGGELGVFQGASGVIKHHKPTLVFEVDENIDRFGYTRNELLDLLQSFAKYDLYFLDRKGNLIPLNQSPDNPNSNMVALPSGTEPPPNI